MRTSTERGIALITTLLVMMLISALLVGFTAIVMSDQRYRFIDRDRVQAFYAASGAMEKMTADLGNMFFVHLAPTNAQVTALTAAMPSIPGVTYGTTSPPNALPASLLSSYTCGPAPLGPRTVGTIGYTIMFCSNAAGDPVATSTGVVRAGAYEGLSAAQTPYQLDVTARTASGGEVHLVRTVEAVAIPVFQFGVFSDVDLAFFAGPNFNFGGRVHTNGNLFLAQGTGTTLTLNNKVTTVLEVIRQRMQNGVSITTAPIRNGIISLARGPGLFRNLADTEGSVLDGVGSAMNEPTWHSISLSTYNSYIRNGRTGAKPLNLPLITAGGSNPDLIRRPVVGENVSNAQLYGERLFGKASLRILLSDRAADITSLPGVTATAPISLGTTLVDSNWNTVAGIPAGYGNPVGTISATTPPIARTPGPIAMSVSSAQAAGWTSLNVDAIPAAFRVPQPLTITNGATVRTVNCTGKTATTFTGCVNPATGGVWSGALASPSAVTTPPNSVNSTSPSTNTTATWPTLTGTITVASTAAFSPAWFYVADADTPGTNDLVTCTGYDSTPRFIGCAAVGGTPRVIGNTVLTTNSLSAAQTGTIGGFIKIEKQDTAGVWTDITAQILNYGIGAPNLAGQICASPTPNAILQLQRLRDNGGGTPAANGGGCNYAGSINAADHWPNALFDTREALQRDAAPVGANVILGGVMYYIAIDAQNLAEWFRGVAPYNAAPFLPNGTNAMQDNNGFTVYFSDRRNNRDASNAETAEFGYEDFVNPSSATGAPNGVLDLGEDVNTSSAPGYVPVLDVYGGVPNFNGTYNDLTGLGALPPLNLGATPLTRLKAGEAQVNRSILFRHALVLMNGRNLRPATGISGLTIVAENPVYVRGDWNANDANNGFGGVNAATAVIADAVTLLSNEWVDTVSFVQPYTPGNRIVLTQPWYRLAIAAGKSMAFPWPAGTANDFGTDGGAHNFLRLLENGGQTVNYLGSIATFFFSRQAVGTFKCCTTVYWAPGRAFAFDILFANPATLPPNTPVFRDLVAVGFSQENRPGR